MEKISVKGSDMHPLYKFLTSKNKNGYKDSSVKWNFQKYLINENGHLVKIISPRTKPDDSDGTKQNPCAPQWCFCPPWHRKYDPACCSNSRLPPT